MKLSKWQIYFLGLLLILTVFLLPRLLWLKKSIQTKATVLYLDKTRLTRPSQEYPVFEYYTSNSRVTSARSYNLPYKIGDTVIIRYNPDEVFDIKIDNFSGHWIDKIIWLAPILFVWTLIFIPKDFSFSILVKNGKMQVIFG